MPRFEISGATIFYNPAANAASVHLGSDDVTLGGILSVKNLTGENSAAEIRDCMLVLDETLPPGSMRVVLSPRPKTESVPYV